MASFVAGVIAFLVGMVALGCGGATPSRRRNRRALLLFLGAFSTLAGLVLIYRVGGFLALAVVGNGLIVLIGFGVVLWYFYGLVASVDEALQEREPPPSADFSFLNEPPAVQASDKPKRRSLAERMGLTTAGERIARMGWFFRKPPG